VDKDCQVRKLNREDAMNCIRWTKQIRDGLTVTGDILLCFVSVDKTTYSF